MKYAIARKDGGVVIMHTIDDATNPLAEIAKWPPDLQAEIDASTVQPITGALPDRTFRSAWKHDLI